MGNFTNYFLELVLETLFKNLLADAAYISIDMIGFLKKLEIKFVTRIHSNRKVETVNGICLQMKKHPNLKLNKNLRSKIVKVKMKNIEVNVVVFKRKKKNSAEYENVYLVTNIDANANDIIKMYDIRWNIEPMFRTMKQSQGLMDCSARSLEKQSLHINSVFFGFAFLQHQKFKKKLGCPEDAIRMLQALKINHASSSFTRFCRDFYDVA